jgi:AcrR family transcriptional regulator
VSRTTDRRAVTRLDPAVRRHQIVEAAAKLFEGRDPTEVPFEEIADAAGVSRALVYNYFGDRNGLLAAVELHLFEAMDIALTENVASDAPAEERFRAVVRAYLHFFAERPGAWQVLRAASLSGHPAALDARRSRIGRVADAWGGTTASRVAATAVVGMLEATVLELLCSRDRRPDLDETGDVLFNLIWRGVTSLGPHGVTAG